MRCLRAASDNGNTYTRLEPGELEMDDTGPPLEDSGDIVQFTSPIFIVEAGKETQIEIDVMRIGQMKGTVRFKYETSECSAREGKQFLKTKGTLEMGPGEGSKTISVTIIDDPMWNPTTEFAITLSDPNGCTLGLYLKVARVKVMDADTFPSNDIKAQIESGKIRSVPKLTLFKGFINTCWQLDDIWWKTIVQLFLDQLSNIYIYLRLVLSVYMVDTVFNMQKHSGLLVPGDRLATSYYVAFLIFAPKLVLHCAAHIKIKMDIRGHIRRDLSQAVFRKFMNYNKQSQEEVALMDMATALTADASELSGCYLRILEIAQIVGKLTISIFFTLHSNPDAWWACVLVPSVMCVWAFFRSDMFIRASDECGDEESALLTFVSDMLGKITLIGEYGQRPQINEMFSKKSEKVRESQIPEATINYNNNALPQMLSPALIAVYTVVGAKLVLTGQLELGLYLATLSVFGDICGSFSDLFGQVMDIVSRSGALIGMTELLNMAIDVPKWQKINQERRETTKSERKLLLRRSASSEDASFVPAADKLDISVSNMSFGYPDADLVLKNITASVPQGSICVVRGDHGNCRRTFLELIGHKMFPTNGSIFVPSHLRILYVSKDPVLLNISPWQNLTFGNSTNNDPSRIEKILKALHMNSVLELCKEDLASRKEHLASRKHEKATDTVNSDTPPERCADSLGDPAAEEGEIEAVKVDPLEKLSATEKVLINFARALIMNPEVLVLNRPFVHYQEAQAKIGTKDILKEALVKHRDHRGFEMPEADLSSRRPRTIFFSSNAPADEGIADYVWVMPKSADAELVVEDKTKSAAWQLANGLW